MQSGISASTELRNAFTDLLSSTTTRAILASINTSPETLTPKAAIESTSSDFATDLQNLEPLLKDNEALYILLREHMSGGSSQCVAVTYVPEKAPVRQKMLFASTRLTLVRELGTEHFSQTLFATSPTELTSTGWSAYLASQTSTAPLTTEEAQLASIKEAEAQESTGTSARRGGQISKNITLPIVDDAKAALEQLKEGGLGLVQLSIDIPSETLKLSGTSAAGLQAGAVGASIATDAPRYSFYRHPDGGVIFIYTCPSASKIKERMLYAASRRSTIDLLAPQLGLEIKGKIEETDGADVSEETILAELGVKKVGDPGGADGAAAAGASRGFARPKRPGRK